MPHPVDPAPLDPALETPGMSRRAIVGAAAWTAPAIALSVASPATAASPALGLIMVAKTDDPLTADTAKGVKFTVSTFAAGVPLDITAEPAGVVTWSPASVVTQFGGSQTVVFSTTETTPQTVKITVNAPGFAPETFSLSIEAPKPVPGTMSVLSGPTSVSVDTSPSSPITIALDPVTAGVPLTLRSEPAGALTFSNANPASDAAGHAQFTISTALTTAQNVTIVASAPGYDDLTIPIEITAKVTTPPPSGGYTHSSEIVSITGHERIEMNGTRTLYVIDDSSTVTIRAKLNPFYELQPEKQGAIFSRPGFVVGQPGVKIVDASPSSIVLNNYEVGSFTVTKHPGAASGSTMGVEFYTASGPVEFVFFKIA